MSMQQPGQPGPDGAAHPTTIKAVDARGGVTPHVVRYVLGFSLVGAILVLGAVYFYYMGKI